VAAENLPVYVGRVWMNGDPWLVADRADAEMWTGAEGDYERILKLGTFETMVDVGAGTGLVLSSDYDDSTIEVFRVSPGELLVVGVRYADDQPYAVLLADAVRVELETSGTITVASGEVAILASALPWRRGTVVREDPTQSPDQPRVPNEEILVLSLEPGGYVLSERHVDRESYGLVVWRLQHERSTSGWGDIR
jgi:hypothetical protein